MNRAARGFRANLQRLNRRFIRLALRHPEHALDENLFFLLVPGESWRAALVVLATLATIIASQALISGVFSMASQAMDLGYLPRIHVRHTSAASRGQIHIPVINALLGAICIALVLAFRSSDALAAAYGIAVTGAMAITSIAYVRVMNRRRGLRWWLGGPLLAGLLVVDLSLFGACLTKIAEGGYVPLLIAAAATTMLLVWRKGRDLVRQSLTGEIRTPASLAARLPREPITRVPGSVAFVVRLLNRRAALKAAPQPPAAPRTRTVDLEHCGACNAYVARGSGACARLDCPMRA